MKTKRTLKAIGARALIFARTQINKHPDKFYMGIWDCGSTCCIGGFCSRYLGIERPYVFGSGLSGATEQAMGDSRSLNRLFFNWDCSRSRDVEYATRRINKFLNKQGFRQDGRRLARARA